MLAFATETNEALVERHAVTPDALVFVTVFTSTLVMVFAVLAFPGQAYGRVGEGDEHYQSDENKGRG